MRWVIAVCLLCLGVAAGTANERNWGTWAEEVRKQHPLAGSVYIPPSSPIDIRWSGNLHRGWDGVFRPLPPDGDAPLPVHRILLLGEVHDNPTHHQLQAWIVDRLRTWLTKQASKGLREQRAAVVLEQIRVDQQPALDQFAALTEAGGGTADDLFRLLEWDKSGWPPAQIYKPLFEAVLVARRPIYAGDPGRDRVRAVARGGLSLVPPEERIRFQLDAPMPALLLDALRRELVDSHCGVLLPQAVEGMAAAQRYRDAHLADVLLDATKRHEAALLIAGNGHMRSDRGVPWQIRQRQPRADVVAALLIEVEDGKTDPEAYMPRDPEGKPAADLLIFTPRAERGDPCEKMRKSKR